jgi:hypothetical protein
MSQLAHAARWSHVVSERSVTHPVAPLAVLAAALAAAIVHGGSGLWVVLGGIAGYSLSGST